MFFLEPSNQTYYPEYVLNDSHIEHIASPQGKHFGMSNLPSQYFHIRALFIFFQIEIHF
jgi:hypothetical protein